MSIHPTRGAPSLVRSAFLLSAAAGLWALPSPVWAQVFVANNGNSTIGEYTTSGAALNTSLITGLSSPEGLAVIPEPAAWPLLAGLAALLFVLLYRRRDRLAA